jgi:hypothetical protein
MKYGQTSKKIQNIGEKLAVGKPCINMNIGHMHSYNIIYTLHCGKYQVIFISKWSTCEKTIVALRTLKITNKQSQKKMK